MDFGCTQTHKDIADLAQKILTNGQDQESITFPPVGVLAEKPWKALAQAGLLTPPGKPDNKGFISDDLLGLQDVCVLLEVWGSCPLSMPVWETIILGRMPLLTFGTQEQKRTFLKKDDAILTAALMEPVNRAWDVPQTRARKQGKEWLLSGEKVCVSWGCEAEGIVVSATTDEGVSLFLITGELIPGESEGVSIQKEHAIDGTPMATLTLKNAHADLLGGRLLKEAEMRWYHQSVVVGMCATQLGLARGALEMTLRYARNREQFGRPIASFQAVRQRAADAWIAYRCLDVVIRRAASQIDHGQDASFDVALARFHAAEKAFEVTRAAQHLHAGAGYDRDYPLYHYQLGVLQAQVLLGGKEWALKTMSSVTMV